MKLSLGVKLLILTICVLFSIIAALVTGFLVYEPGHLRSALVTGGGAFATTMLVCLYAAAFLLRGDPDP